MTSISSYQQAQAVMAKARKPEAGKPLGPVGWRMYKDGDEFAVNYKGTLVARILPNNTLRMVCNKEFAIRMPPGVGHAMHNVLPVALVNRSKGLYRLHVRLAGAPEQLAYSNYGAADWDEWNTGGYRLYDGLTIDLAARKAVGYVEPKQVIDTEARALWLVQLKTLKRYLKTVVKLGGFTARLEAMNGVSRWEVDHFNQDDIPMTITALRGNITEEFLNRFATLMLRHHYRLPSVQEQTSFVDFFFNNHSVELRTALGVIK